MAADLPDINVPPAEAIRFFRDKGFEIGFNWQDVFQEEHATRFTVAKVMRLDILADIRAELDRALAEGRTFRQFQQDLTPILQAKGWWGVQQVTDPATGRLVDAQLGSPRRLRIIFDTNMRSARAAGRWEKIQRLKDRRPFLRYSAVLDRRTRPLHRSWHGTILPVDHEWWNTHFPPNGWNCRCIAIQMSQFELDQQGLSVTAVPPLNARPFTNRRTGEIVNVPRGIDPGFAFNIGQAHMAGVGRAATAAVVKTATDPDLFAAARASVRDIVNSTSFERFMRARDGELPVMALDADLAADIGTQSPVATLSAAAWRRLRRQQPDITLDDYRRLPVIADNPDLIVSDGGSLFMLIRRGADWLMATVRVSSSGRANVITNVRLADDQEVDRLRAAGQIIRESGR